MKKYKIPRKLKKKIKKNPKTDLSEIYKNHFVNFLVGVLGIIIYKKYFKDETTGN